MQLREGSRKPLTLLTGGVAAQEQFLNEIPEQ
jgi:hypothetical protein